MTVRQRQMVTIALGVLCGAGILGMAVARLNQQRSWQALKHAALWPWLPLALLNCITGYIVRGIRCRILVSRESAVSIPAATHVVVTGYAVNMILPARLGEFARAGMLAERSGLPFVQTLTVTFLERLFDGLAIMLLMSVALMAVPPIGWIALLFRDGWCLFGMASVLVALTVLCPGYVLTLSSRLASRVAPRLHDALLRSSSSVINGVSYLRRLRHVLVLSLLSVAVWMLEAGMYLSFMPALGIPASPGTALLSMAVTNLGILMPSTPGFIAPFQFHCAQTLASTGVATDLAVSHSVLVHLTFYIPITVWGVAALLGYALTLSKMMAIRHEARHTDAVTDVVSPGSTRLAGGRTLARAEEATPFIRAIAEAIIPAEDRGTRPTHEDTVDQTATFVQGQVDALAPQLRAMFTVGMTGFRVITRLVYFRSFAGLPLEDRRRWVEAWAYGRVALARQLFRAVRTTALLAYYELEGAQTTPIPASSELAGESRQRT